MWRGSEALPGLARGGSTAVIFCRVFGAKKMELDTLMLRKPRRSLKLFGTIDTTVFTVVLVVVVLVLFVTLNVPTGHHGMSVDIPAVWHPVAMRGALREDAMLVTVTRDGRIWFGRDQVAFGSLAGKIQDRLKDRGIERKVYVKVDLRARYGAVKEVLDSVRAAGILRVAFMVNQRRVGVSL